MEIKGILFDKDGTLIDFFEVWGKAIGPVLDQVLESYHLEDQIGIKEKMLKKIGVHGDEIDQESSFAWKTLEFISDDIAEILEEYSEGNKIDLQQLREYLSRLFYMETVVKQKEIPIFTDLKKLMEELHSMGIQTGLVTTDEYASTWECMEKIGIVQAMTFYGTAGLSMPVKPEKELLLRAAAHWSLKPEEIAVVGDTPNDMRFARNANAIGIGVLSGCGKYRELNEIADHIIDSVADLLPLVEKLNGKESVNGEDRAKTHIQKI